MDQNENKICPHCGSEMTSVFKNKRITYVCETCDGDPMKSPKVQTMLNAVRPPD
jgi:uncharacterized Zn finger protein